jgi:hypothetical protein
MRIETRESLRGWATDVAVITLIGVFLGVLGPFGNFFNGPVWQRIPYWVGMAWCGTLVYGGALRLIVAQGWSGRQVWLALAVLVLVASAPFAAFSFRVASTIWPVLKRAPDLSPAVWYGEGVLTAAPQVALFYLLHQRRRAERAKAAGRAATPGALLGARPAEVLCLSMEDHYVRVHTPTGSTLVLATLAQGITALNGAPGLQVHRSWWVAERAVVGAIAEGRNLRLRLTNGLTAPVARTSVAAVRAAGWLER